MTNPISDYLPKVEKKTVVDYRNQTYITPYLPGLALGTAQDHRSKGKPVFVKALLHNPGTAGYCKNCGGGEVIYLTMVGAGPFQSVPATKKSITWFDGDEMNGKGWYIIERTVTFPCPECVRTAT